MFPTTTTTALVLKNLLQLIFSTFSCLKFQKFWLKRENTKFFYGEQCHNEQCQIYLIYFNYFVILLIHNSQWYHK